MTCNWDSALTMGSMFCPRMPWQFSDFIVTCGDSRHLMPYTVKQPYDITEPPPCVTVGMLFCYLRLNFCSLSSSVNIQPMWLSKLLSFWFICPKGNLPEALRLLDKHLSTLRGALVIQKVTYEVILGSFCTTLSFLQTGLNFPLCELGGWVQSIVEAT